MLTKINSQEIWMSLDLHTCNVLEDINLLMTTTQLGINHIKKIITILISLISWYMKRDFTYIAK